MIEKISKIKNFGIFHDFAWKTEVPEFKKFNLIYGWNRSGKTTLSRIFVSCEKKCLFDIDKFKQYPENGEYEIRLDDSTVIKSSDIDSNELLIKVFNQDFIDDNISFEPSNSSNPIIYVSEEDIESRNHLNQLKIEQTNLTRVFNEAKKDASTKEEIKNTFLTSLGREIANILFDKSYNRTKVENRINSIGLDSFLNHVLVESDEKKFAIISKSEAQNEQQIVSKPPLVHFDYLYTRIKSTLDKTVASVLLERLKDHDDVDGGLDEDLNNWVKQGFDIHKLRNQFTKCLFCDNNFDSNFFESLSKHFSKDYEDLQSSIEFLIKDLNKERLEIISDKNFELYADMRVEYEALAKEYNGIIKNQNEWISNSVMWLEQKYKNPFSPDIPQMVDAPDDFTKLLGDVVERLNALIIKHNERVKNHTAQVSEARNKLELHAIAVAISAQDYKKLENEIGEARRKEEEALIALNTNTVHVSELEKRNSNIGAAVIKINNYLKEFFGRKEIELELDNHKKGYVIKRDGLLAKNLSEGEKTAIAFSYFIVKVGEKEFKIQDGVIFIDDPISSFDSNFIYHCFSLINTHFKDAGQLFISTHNFQLFNLLKEWFINKNSKTRKDNDKNRVNGGLEKSMPCEFFMVENYTELDIRKAKLVMLDKTLRDYKSEYHFLFSLLNKFKDTDLNYADLYTIGNVARRFFDIFADFKIPDSRDPRQKMETMVKEINKGKNDNEKISDADLYKAYKLVNEFSHNSDPTSAIEHKEKSESKDAIKILLRIVKESDIKHFEILEKNLA